MSALAIIEMNEDPAMGLDLPSEQSFEEWVDLGKRLCAGAKVVNWWIGDWWAAGTHRYGARAEAAAAGIFGREFGALRNIAVVCRSFETSRRRDTLSFTHHQEVAALAPAEADRLLDKAERNNWSTRELRDAVADTRESRIPSWIVPRQEPRFDRAGAKEAVFTRLAEAARDGAICPTADELMEVSGVGSVSTTVAIVQALEEEGRIQVERYQRGRTVTILATGQSTAEPSDKTPHWREISREAPTPTVEAVNRASPSLAAAIWAKARSKGRTPQEYLLDLVWLGWEVECERDSADDGRGLDAAA